jgi:CBS domain containing-hemolysin-like protein
MGEESGSLGARESQFVQNLIQLHVMKTWDIMTPRPVIFALPESTLLIDFVQMIEDKPFTRIPVYRSTRDEVTGFVIRGEALLAHLKDADDTGTLAMVARPIAVTPEDTPVDELFQRFVAERHQLMLVTDEFETTVGLVTMEDVIETIFGFEIMDEQDKVPDMQSYARNLWQERARKMGLQLPESAAVPAE